jgi:hypothetical protein
LLRKVDVVALLCYRGLLFRRSTDDAGEASVDVLM